ncbi:DNA-binding response regulator [Bacillus sp. M6-12]|uniref:response regulator transcription factor n=1 Tax=Bacillus sp. M6-12 TaxID=2054166 RepID=UPI000C784251|nr:response regulator transcription factor [Bacillus sp. M6-12]PLS15439.1 DNA-binding response regulator [Bacillus sp. M6-12]
MEKHRILIVEDDIEIAGLIMNHLKERSYRVTWASTGTEGWEDFQSQSFDMAIIDLMLPEMDGFTLCKNIRWSSPIPLLILSARHEEDDKIKGLKLGADDYLTKPFSLRELEARIESQLRRYGRYHSQAQPAEKWTFAHGLEIFPEKKTAEINGVEACLTVKEFALLCLMANNPHRTFSKKELYEHIWEQNDVDGNNTVTVHIKSLRTKLKDPLKTPYFIQTVWGNGYRFVGAASHEN